MKRKAKIFILSFILIQIPVIAGKDVQSVIDQLQSAIDTNVKNWIFTKDVTIDPLKIEDFSSWEPYKLGKDIGGETAWLKGSIRLPKKFLGYDVSGSKVFLNLELDDAGLLWTNGVEKGRFEWNGRYVLTDSALPDVEYILILRGINYGGPLRLLKASIEIEPAVELVNRIEDLILSLKTSKKLLSFDTYQRGAWISYDPKIDKSIVPKKRKLNLQKTLDEGSLLIDTKALENGDRTALLNSLDKSLKSLKPVKDFIKEFTLELIGNAHIDAAWLWRKSETIEVSKSTFDNALRLMDSYPDFTFAQSSAYYYKWMEDLYPETFKGIKSKVKSGYWELVGGMMIEPDCNLINGESWARHILYAKRYFREKFGIDVNIGWNPDSFGYNWNMPQIYLNGGINAFITQKISWNDINVFPHRVFWWEGPDGSRILVYFPFSYVYDFKDPFRLVDQLRQFEANTGFRNMLVLYGVGDHGGGPSEEMLKVIARLKSLPIFPTVKFSTSKKYFEDFLLKQDLSKIPVWNDELYLEYHRGTFTTQAEIKRHNRIAENLLANAEGISVVSHLLGGYYNREAFKEAWRLVLFNQFHDILPGSSIREVYVDALKDYEIAEALTKKEMEKSLKYIASKINTSGIKGEPLIVFNPSPWKRRDVVKIEIARKARNEEIVNYIVADPDGKEIPSQIISLKEGLPPDITPKALLFVAEDVPAFGYKVFDLQRIEKKEKLQKTWPQGDSIENEFFRIKMDREKGWIKSIFDKKNGKEILSGAGNLLQLFGDKPPRWDAWDIGYTGKEWTPGFRKLELIENGPVRKVLRAYLDFFNPESKAKRLNAEPTLNYPNSFFTCDTILYDKINRIEFKTQVDWWEEHTLLKTAFDVDVKNNMATYEIPFGSIQRPTTMNNDWEKARYEVPGLKWIDFSAEDYGVSILTRSKYGYDVHGNRMRISLLRSPKDPDPTADRGQHEIEYALFPHKGCWRMNNTPRLAYDYNNPLIAFLSEKHDGSLPISNSFLNLEPENIILSSLKLSEDDKSIILRTYEAHGKDTEARIVLPFTPEEVFTVDFLEKTKAKVEFSNNTIKIFMPKNKVVTLKIILKNSSVL
ncbi:MAG: glycoside hydrolase family 38 C-terminal domain-containing protein [Acidobacteriota bacterium]